jgi:hypothetical protein
MDREGEASEKERRASNSPVSKLPPLR